MGKHAGYVWWKHLLFWVGWSLLLVPGYCAAFGTWLIGSMLPDYHHTVDIVLTIILAVSLFAIMMVAVYTAWHFFHQSRRYAHLMVWLGTGVFVLPLVSGIGAVLSYAQLMNISL